MEGFGRGLDVGIVGANHRCRAFALHFDFRLDALGRQLLYEVCIALEDVVRILVGHQAHGDLGRGFSWNYGLCTGRGEAPGHAVDLERGARPRAIQDRVARFAGQGLGTDFGLAIVLFVEWQTLPGFEFVLAWRLHVFIEAGDEDFAFRV